MRYYSIEIAPAAGGTTPLIYTSKAADGTPNPGALQVELDLPVNSFTAPAGLGAIKIRGVSFADITEASYLSGPPGRAVVIRGGMLKGLPLANPAQAGILFEGQIYQAFGNWQGTDVSLDLIVAPLAGSIDMPVNLAGKWQTGQSLQDFLTMILQQGFPGSVITGTLASNLVATQDVPIAFTNVVDLAQWANRVSLVVNNAQGSVTTKFVGAFVTQTGNGFKLFDGTQASDQVTKIAYTDMIGNGTWLGVNQVQFKVVLRSDLAVGDLIQLPDNSNLLNIVNSFTQFRQDVSFKNTFQIVSLRHLGNSRQADADSWCTIINAVTSNASSSGATL